MEHVDPDSPSENSGLRARDCVLQVNGTNVKGLTHAEVLQLFQNTESELELIVISNRYSISLFILSILLFMTISKIFSDIGLNDKTAAGEKVSPFPMGIFKRLRRIKSASAGAYNKRGKLAPIFTHIS